MLSMANNDERGFSHHKKGHSVNDKTARLQEGIEMRALALRLIAATIDHNHNPLTLLLSFREANLARSERL
jgi:hypothetical protein